MGCIEDIEFSTKYEIPTTDNKQTNKSTGYSNESTEFTKKRIRNVGSTKNQPIIYVMGKTLVQKIDVSDDCLDACKNYTCPNKGRCKNHFRVPKCDCVGTGFYGKDCQKGKILSKLTVFFFFSFFFFFFLFRSFGIKSNLHCVKSVRTRSFFWSVISFI